MGWKRGILKIVLCASLFATGFALGSYYGGFFTGLSTTSLTSIFTGLTINDVLWGMYLLREIFTDRKEEKKEKHREWKRRVLIAYEAYITSLETILFTGKAIDNYGWPDVAHKKEAEASLVELGKGIYDTWKNCVQIWNDYINSPMKTGTRDELDARYRQKVTYELSKSGIPNIQADNVRNRNYADYERFAKAIVQCWAIGDTFTTSIGRVRQLDQADSTDDKKLQQLVDKINALTPSIPQKDPLRIEYEGAVEQFKKDLDKQDEKLHNNWSLLLKCKESFLASLKEFRDDIDADRIGPGAM